MKKRHIIIMAIVLITIMAIVLTILAVKSIHKSGNARTEHLSETSAVNETLPTTPEAMNTESTTTSSSEVKKFLESRDEIICSEFLKHMDEVTSALQPDADVDLTDPITIQPQMLYYYYSSGGETYALNVYVTDDGVFGFDIVNAADIHD